ncbi:beta-galactosidase [Niabella sp. CC-SYL272]|uniref:beta-galactosidase n=1 Tax=Niabella agricola TaxID=2891571 RepID=UPI001F26856B|nr:beta-galactosidase [Niabella agricola]MCF3109886.1 beta-galactosidase [Niabella agricola]
MKHRFVLLFCTAICLFTLNAAAQQSPAAQKAQPKWADGFPVIMIGNWDVKPSFRRRVGANPVWMDEVYKRESTEAQVKKYKEMGATMVMAFFYKGFGLNAEKEEIDATRKLAALCKKYGLKTGAYVGATLPYETFLPEVPEARDWIAPPYQGQPVTYGSQTFRKLVYFQHEGYKTYIKRVLKIAIEDLKVDLIHFDNSSIQAIAPVFYHPLAAEQFREFLRKKYTPEQLRQRLGFSNVDYVEPPSYTKSISILHDPLAQEWTDFRCQRLADYYGEMAEYIRSLNPDVAVECNPHGLDGRNSMWNESVDFPRLLAHTNYFWTEGEHTELAADGTLLSKIRTFKMARTLNNRVFTNTSDSKLKMAEILAYNRDGIGLIGGLEEMEGGKHETSFELSQDQKDYIRFFRDHFEYYTGTTNIADVAVLHSFNTMAYNNDRPYQSTFLFEQSLIQGKIPFDIIFDEQLKNLDRYKVLVLADQESLTDEQQELIRAFVRNGGGLVATEHTSLYNSWHQRKAQFGLYDLFKVNAPEWHNRSTPETILSITGQRNNIGKGRVAYLPEVIPSQPKPAMVAMSGKYFRLAKNHRQLIEAIRWASGDALSIEVEAPETVTMELVKQENRNRLLLHLVNFNYQNSGVENIKVASTIPGGKKIQQVRVLSPDGKTSNTPAFQQEKGRVHFTVPQLKLYNLVVIRYK